MRGAAHSRAQAVSTLAIEINDAELVVAGDSGILGTERGYATVSDGRILTGDDACALVRLKPRQTSNRYWDDLSMEEGSAGVEDIGSAAELAFAQLDSLWRRFGGAGDDAILIVPGHYSRDQLGLLLGLAQECGMPVRAMVDAAVAASAGPYPGHQLIYVDAGLHRVFVTPLQQGEDVSAQAQQALDGVGLASLMDLWAKRVAEVFVLSTRFDPFHRADSEQLVYDRLPQWLATLQEEGRAELQLPHGDDEHRVEVERDQLLGVANGFYRALVQLIAQSREAGASLVVQVSHRLLGLPGVMSELLRLDDAHVVPLAQGAAALGALGSIGRIDTDGQVRLLKRLSWRQPPAAPIARATKPGTVSVSEAAQPRPPEATHVVYRGVAYAVNGEGLLIGREQLDGRRTVVLHGGHSAISRAHCELVRRDGELRLTDLSRYGTFVNEKRVSGETVLAPADVIRIGSPGEQLQVIVVGQGNGS